MLLVCYEWSAPAVQALVCENATGEPLGRRQDFGVRAGGLKVGCANVGRRWKRGMSASGETELVQHGTGGNEAGHAGQIDQAEHAG